LSQAGEVLAAMPEAHVAHQDLYQSFHECFISSVPGACWDYGRVVMRGKLRVPTVEIWIVEVALEDALLEAVRDSDVCDTTVELKHSAMTAQPISAARFLDCPGEQQLAEAQTCNKHVCLVSLAGGHLDPLERVAGVIDLDTLAGFEIARGDRGLPVLREPAVPSLPTGTSADGPAPGRE
jgi:hypothetical protein